MNHTHPTMRPPLPLSITSPSPTLSSAPLTALSVAVPYAQPAASLVTPKSQEKEEEIRRTRHSWSGGDIIWSTTSSFHFYPAATLHPPPFSLSTAITRSAVKSCGCASKLRLCVRSELGRRIPRLEAPREQKKENCNSLSCQLALSTASSNLTPQLTFALITTLAQMILVTLTLQTRGMHKHLSCHAREHLVCHFTLECVKRQQSDCILQTFSLHDSKE